VAPGSVVKVLDVAFGGLAEEIESHRGFPTPVFPPGHRNLADLDRRFPLIPGVNILTTRMPGIIGVQGRGAPGRGMAGSLPTLRGWARTFQLLMDDFPKTFCYT